jgi:hypothetical protein
VLLKFKNSSTTAVVDEPELLMFYWGWAFG